MRRAISLLLSLGVSLGLANLGCATLTTGMYQGVKLGVSPAGAALEVYDWQGTEVAKAADASSGKLQIRRSSKSYVVVARREGHCPQYWLTRVDVAPGAWLDIAPSIFPLAGTILSWSLLGVDAATGAIHNVEPKRFEARLSEASQCAL